MTMELVTGATGYVGRRLIERLSRAGRPVRALARDPTRLEERPGVEPAPGDLVSGKGLEEALEGCSTAYYLVHSMEAGSDDFASRDRRAVRNFARAARAAGLERAVYLGGLVPAGGPRSVHLRSRLEVERILLEELPRSTAALRGLDPDRRRIVVVQDPRSARRAPANPALSGLASAPHPTDRRARRPRVPRPDARATRGRGAVARHRGAGCAELRADDRANRRPARSRAPAAPARDQPDPGGERGGRAP